MNATTDRDRVTALTYPSTNDWIIEQIALWLWLGRLPHFSLGTLSPAHVLQGDGVRGDANGLSAQRPCALFHRNGEEVLCIRTRDCRMILSGAEVLCLGPWDPVAGRLLNISDHD